MYNRTIIEIFRMNDLLASFLTEKGYSKTIRKAPFARENENSKVKRFYRYKKSNKPALSFDLGGVEVVSHGKREREIER